MPILGPRFKRTPKANQPAIVCTHPAAATSWNPNLVTNQPSGCHPHDAPKIHTTEPRIVAKNTKELILILSITEPEKIEAVVHAKSVNAAQNTPVAWSLNIGPIETFHGAPYPSKSIGTNPPGKAK